jgi:hypothetical protein
MFATMFSRDKQRRIVLPIPVEIPIPLVIFGARCLRERSGPDKTPSRELAECITTGWILARKGVNGTAFGHTQIVGLNTPRVKGESC